MFILLSNEKVLLVSPDINKVWALVNELRDFDSMYIYKCEDSKFSFVDYTIPF